VVRPRRISWKAAQHLSIGVKNDLFCPQSWRQPGTDALPLCHPVPKKRHNPLFYKGLWSGGYRDRTCDLLNAIQTLSQLS
jgi:hypothetical protein